MIEVILQNQEDASEQMTFFNDESKEVLDISPGMTVPVIAGNEELRQMQWGFRRNDGKLLINMRSETAEVLFKKPMQQGRCLIPASGYYEWQTAGTQKTKFRFFLPKGILYLAGCWQVEENSETARFVILTRAATEAFNEIHHRMPVVIPESKIHRWLQESPNAMYNPIVELLHRRMNY